MAGIFDTHCHPNDHQYKEDDINKIFREAAMSNVSKICCVGFSLRSSREAVNLAMTHQEVYAAVGIHPTDTKKHKLADLDEIEALAQHNSVVAIGEIGLDFYHTNVGHETQKTWFIKQLRIAKKLNLPVNIHCREAYDECLEILKAENMHHGIMHCFLGTGEQALKFIAQGFYISFSGVITFRNARILIDTVEAVPLDRILVETDAPYLTPHPYRGKRNYPKYIKYSVAKLAEIKKITTEEMIRITSRNANHVYRIK